MNVLRLYRRKVVPTFWWDYEHGPNGAMNIVVASDDPRFRIVARPEDVGAALRIIEDLEAGRADPHKLAARLVLEKTG
jgi:hypothetical protein